MVRPSQTHSCTIYCLWLRASTHAEHTRLFILTHRTWWRDVCSSWVGQHLTVANNANANLVGAALESNRNHHDDCPAGSYVEVECGRVRRCGVAQGQSTRKRPNTQGNQPNRSKAHHLPQHTCLTNQTSAFPRAFYSTGLSLARCLNAQHAG